jgi:hypothetical protein
MRRVSYHQSVFDLVRSRPRESAQARRLIEECERRRGTRLPESVRQWYLTEGALSLWYDYSNMDRPEPLEDVLRQFAHEWEGGPPWWAEDRVQVLIENQGCCVWFIHLDGSDDPPVFEDPDYDHRHYDSSGVPAPGKVANRFSDFLFDWITRFYGEDWTPLSERSPYPGERTRRPLDKRYLDGLWLYAPAAEPLAAPYLDFLIENWSEDSRRKMAGGVMQYRFRASHGSLCVTTDAPGEEGGVSAWWLHADAEEELYRLAKQVWWCCDLRDTLRAWTEIAQTVLERLRESGQG